MYGQKEEKRLGESVKEFIGNLGFWLIVAYTIYDGFRKDSM